MSQILYNYTEIYTPPLKPSAKVSGARPYPLLDQSKEPESQYALRHLAHTLNVAAMPPNRVWFLQVGEEATIIRSDVSPMDVMFWFENGEYANQTYFITDVSDAHIHTCVIEQEIDQISLMTDGRQTLALVLQQRAAHTPFFESKFRGVEALNGTDTDAHRQLQAGLARFLNSSGVNARTSDDKPLVLTSRRATSVPPPDAPARETDSSTAVTVVEEETPV